MLSRPAYRTFLPSQPRESMRLPHGSHAFAGFWLDKILTPARESMAHLFVGIRSKVQKRMRQGASLRRHELFQNGDMSARLRQQGRANQFFAVRR